MKQASKHPVRAAPARPGADGILAAALAAFYELGYGGTTVRMIASRSNITVAAIYHHFPSKQAILLTVMRDAMRTVLADASEAWAACGDDPPARLAALVDTQVRYHTAHSAEAFVANSELRSLSPRNRREVVRLRDRYEALFADTIAQGCAAGCFDVADPKQPTRAIVAMCGAVATWYRPGGPLPPDKIVADYVDLAFRMVGYRP